MKIVFGAFAIVYGLEELQHSIMNLILIFSLFLSGCDAL
jgi:hypothetical protein